VQRPGLRGPVIPTVLLNKKIVPESDVFVTRCLNSGSIDAVRRENGDPGTLALFEIGFGAGALW
jgi:hypothetical protein